MSNKHHYVRYIPNFASVMLTLQLYVCTIIMINFMYATHIIMLRAIPSSQGGVAMVTEVKMYTRAQYHTIHPSH